MRRRYAISLLHLPNVTPSEVRISGWSAKVLRLAVLKYTSKAYLPVYDGDDRDDDVLIDSLVQGSSAAAAPMVAASHTSRVPANPSPPGDVIPSPVTATNAAPPESETSGNYAARYTRIRRQLHSLAAAGSRGSSSDPGLEWMCVMCQTFNFMGRKSCRKCTASNTLSFTDRDRPSRHVTTFPATWLCEECGANNKTVTDMAGASRPELPKASRMKFFCSSCKKPFGGVREWHCPSCREINGKASVQCATCFEDRPAFWKCASCDAANSIFAVECRSCKEVRAHKDSSSTVVCAGCGCRNDVRWELCEGCMAPMPAMTNALKRMSSVRPPASLFTPPPTRAESEPSAPPAVKTPILPTAVEGIGSPAPARNFPETEPDSRKDPGRSPRETSEMEGAWWCTNCNIQLRRNATFCDVCLSLREQSALGAGQARKEPQPAGAAADPAPPIPGSWQCPYCRQFQSPHAAECCGHPRELPNGYWLCSMCSSVNRFERGECLGCGAGQVPVPWPCPMCGRRNSGDAFECETCVSPHPTLWQCSSCKKSVHLSKLSCPVCQAPRPAASLSVACPVCKVPNRPTRKGCHRCRARLQDDEWTCNGCHTVHHNHTVLRCTFCQKPRAFNMAERVWVCDVCSTPVVTGSDADNLTQCPRCGSGRTEASLSFPSRWMCRDCGISNVIPSPKCVECGSIRRVNGLDAKVCCPHCFRTTVLTDSELCGDCGGSLSGMLSDAGGSVSFSLTADTALDTTVREAALVATAESMLFAHQSASQRTTHSERISTPSRPCALLNEGLAMVRSCDGTSLEEDVIDDDFLPLTDHDGHSLISQSAE